MPHNKELSKHPQRKLTTILAADVVGYSKMMGVDEDGTHELLGKCRRIIDRNIEHHGGRIFNSAGDSVMAEFGSTVEAVRCAIEIQEEFVARNADKPEPEQMWFRIGLNVGDVIIEGDDLIGDGVNIASRMESIATPGGICMSGSVYELVHNKLSFAFEDMGKQSVKNIIEPISAYSLLPAATPKIAEGMPEQVAITSNSWNLLKFRYIAVMLLLVAAGSIVTYFTVIDKDTEDNLQAMTPPKKITAEKPSQEPGVTSVDKTEDPGVRADTVPPQDNMPANRPRITPSYFADRTVEGVAIMSGERFVIEMTSSGSAVVTLYKKDEPNIRRGSDIGRWWIDTSDRICFKFKIFAQGRQYCRIHSPEEDGEFLVAGDPGKPKWKLHPK